jgi:formate dehydrogenase iron-sulfur subunit
MPKAILIDTTRCIGCKGCQVACKQWKNLPAEQAEFTPEESNPDKLSTKTLSHVMARFGEKEDGRPAEYFVKRQCMHCNEPSCVAACPTDALRKTDEGPVVYDSSKCIGCKLCTIVCPFSVPRFGWGKTLDLIKKCNLCYDRILAGMKTACASTCANNAIMFGERDDLIAEAERRIRAHPDKYVNHIYGKDEVGGTSVLYLSSVPFEELGFKTDLGDEPLPALKKRTIPGTAIGLGVILTDARDKAKPENKGQKNP